MTRRNQDRGAFGSVNQLPSGRWRAQYYGPEGSAGPRYKAPTTFPTKRVARQFLATIETDIIRGKWMPPADPTSTDNVSRSCTLADYADEWLPNRLIDGEPLKDRTREHYRKLLDAHILPVLGSKPIASITADDVRKWHAGTLTDAPTLRAHAYSLLRTILTTAVTDQKLAVQPCTIRGAGSTKRVITIEPATVDQLAKLVDAMPERYRCMVLLASWCALRFGELTELRRKDVHVEEGLIQVRRGVVYLRAGRGFKPTTPKSKSAGIRDVHVPPHILPALRDHLVEHTEPGPESLLFPAHHGGHLHPATLEPHFHKAREAAGRPDLRFHDLRHTGAVLAASTGATLAELMARLGHSTVSAAMRYQHAAEGADKRIAAALSELATTQ
jgi:integrase